MPPPPSSRVLRNGDHLKSLGGPQAVIDLVAWLDAIDQSGQPPDADELMSVGVAFSRAKMPSVSAAALGWLDAAVSERRVDTAALLLAGVWTASFHPPASDADVARLIAAADQVPLGGEPARSVFVALYRALLCGLSQPAWGRVTARLQTTLADPVIGPSVRDLEPVVRRTLATSAPVQSPP